MDKDKAVFLADVLICSVEGGTGYWAQVSEYKHDGLSEIPLGQTSAVLYDTDEEVSYALTLGTIELGIHRILEFGFKINPTLRHTILQAWVSLDASEIDADAADVIVQAGLFDEIVYG